MFSFTIPSMEMFHYLPNYPARLHDIFITEVRETIGESAKRRHLCGRTERSEVLLDVLSVMLTLQLPPEAVNKSCCKAGLEVGIGLCSPIPTITKLDVSVLASILGPPRFVIMI